MTSPAHRAPGDPPTCLPSGESTIPTKPRSYSQDWKAPASFAIWGATAADRSRLAWAIAHRIDPDLYWLQVENPQAAHDPAEYAVIDRVPPDHCFFLDPSDLTPDTDLGNMASWFVRDDIAPDDRIRTLADFMRLPILGRHLLEGRSSFDSTKAVVTANSDRAAKLYTAKVGGVRPFVEAINSKAATIIFTISTAPQRQNAPAVDYLFRLEDQDPGGISVVKAECVQGAPRGVPGLFSAGYRRPLSVLIEEIERI
ncbi:MAG TPA: hypothetical protein VK424_03650 [Thermoplasmata archaeon]|nr:hypothetical protein [Thermoplasmata archaeon]